MKVGVYGLGRFGFFWSELLAQKFNVSGYNRSPLTLNPNNVALVSEDSILQSDVLFLCVSIFSPFRARSIAKPIDIRPIPRMPIFLNNILGSMATPSNTNNWRAFSLDLSLGHHA